MKIQVLGGALHAAAAWAAKLAPIGAALPILGGIRLAADDELRLSATDFDTFGSVTVASTVLDAGETVVSARLLAAIAKTLRADDEVLIETGVRGIELHCGRSRWVLPELADVDNWPQFPELGDPIGKIPAEVFARGLARVLPAVSTQTSPPEMTGVSFDVGDALTLTTTDRYRLASVELSWQQVLDSGRRQLIVPVGVLQAAVAAVAGNADDISIHSDGNTVGFAAQRHRMLGRLIAGQYPRWRPILEMPERDAATTVTVDIAALTRAVTQVTAAIKADAKATPVIRMEFTEDGVGVWLGEDSSYVKVRQWEGRSLTLGVNPQYLLTALALLESPVAVLKFIAAGPKPFLLKPADEHGDVIDDGYGHVVIGMKLAEAQVAA